MNDMKDLRGWDGIPKNNDAADNVAHIIYARMQSREKNWEEVYRYIREVYAGVMQKITQLLTANGILIAATIFVISQENLEPSLSLVAIIGFAFLILS